MSEEIEFHGWLGKKLSAVFHPQVFFSGIALTKISKCVFYFQRYYWFKRSFPIWSETSPFPIDVENMVRDTLEAVRPKLKLLESFEEACKACDDLENEYKPKIGKW